MQRDDIKLRHPLAQHYEEGRLDDAIVTCLFAAEKTPEVFFNLSLFQTLSGYYINHAEENLLKALKMLGTRRLAELDDWATFFSKHHCPQLAYRIYAYLISTIDKEPHKLLNFSAPRSVTNEQLKKAANLAIRCGFTDEAEKYLNRLETSDTDSQDLSFCVSRDMLNLARGDLTPANTVFKNEPLLKLQYSIKSDAAIHYYIWLLMTSPKPEKLHEELCDTYSDNPKLLAKLNYFYAVEACQDNQERIKIFQSTFQIEKADKFDRLLASIALVRLDPRFTLACKDFYATAFPEYNLIHHNPIENCIYAMAAATLYHSTREESYKNRVQSFLEVTSNISPANLLPFSIPFYLRPAYFEMLLDEAFWPVAKKIKYDWTYNLAEWKRQIHCLIESDSIDVETRINLAIQALCPVTAIGRVMNVAQLSTTDLTSGTKGKIVAFLSKQLSQEGSFAGYLSSSTRSALTRAVENNKDFLQPLDIIDVNLKELLSSSVIEPRIYAAFHDAPEPGKYDKLYPLDDFVFRNQLGEHEFAKTAVVCDKMINSKDVSFLPYSLVKILCLAKLNHQIDAHQEFILLLKLYPEEKANFGDFFFRWDCFRLAVLAYKEVEKTLTNKQIVNAAQANIRLGKIENAKAYTQRILEPSLPKFYYQTYRDAYHSAKKRAYERALPGLHRIKFQPAVDLSYVNECQKIYNSSADFISLDALYLRNLILDAESIYTKNTIPELSSVLIHCISLNELNQTTLATGVIEFETRLQFIYQQLKFNNALDNVADEMMNIITNASKIPNCHANLALLLRIKVLMLLKRNEQAIKELTELQIPEEGSEENILACLIKHIYLMRLQPKYKEELQVLVSKFGINPVRSPALNCILAKACLLVSHHQTICALLDNSSIAPHIMLLGELPNYYHVDYFEIVCHQKNWPQSNIETKNNSELKQIKESYVDYVRLTADMNVGLQALCPRTAIGRMFSEPRWYSTSLNAGSIANMLEILQRCVTTVRKEQQLSIHTRQAIVITMEEDPEFLKYISKYYPDLGELLKRVARDARDLTLRPNYFKPVESRRNQLGTTNSDFLDEKLHPL